MMDRLRLYWAFINGSLWFLPLLMSFGAIILGAVLLNIDGILSERTATHWMLYTGRAENARNLMAALLSSMITMTALVISITIVVLALAAGQIGPRLIRNFIGDRVVQTVLGLFISTILYLLTVFRTLDGGPNADVPHLAVTTGTALSALCLFILLFFVHKLARSIIYDNVVHGVAVNLRTTIHQLLPEEPSPRQEIAPPDTDGAWISLAGDGYIQTIEFESLLSAAEKADAMLHITVRPGHYVLARGEHVAVHPAEACTHHLVKAIRRAFILGAERTPTQDLEFGIRQLVEIALRALSPGINDTFTAVAVIDNLSSGVAQIFDRGLEPRILCDRDGKCRILRDVTDHDGIVEAAFNQIRQSGKASPAVLIRLIDALGRLAPYIRTDTQQQAVLAQLATILETAEENVTIPGDLDHIRHRHATTCRHLGCAPPDRS